MDITFKKTDLTTIVTIDLNAEQGQWDDDEAPIRYTVHRVLDNVQVELRDNPPVKVQGDRIVLSALVLTSTERTKLLEIRDGTHGLPVYLSNSFIAGNGIQGVFVIVESTPNPGMNHVQLDPRSISTDLGSPIALVVVLAPGEIPGACVFGGTHAHCDQ